MALKYFEPLSECQASNRPENAESGKGKRTAKNPAKTEACNPQEAKIGSEQKSAKKIAFLFAFRAVAVNILGR